MQINNPLEYFGAKEYERRLNNILADGSSFLRGQDLELFGASLRHELAQVARAIEEYEARTGLSLLAPSRLLITEMRLEGAVGGSVQPSVLWSSSASLESAGISSALQDWSADRQLHLFPVGNYAEEPSAVFSPSLEPVGLAA